MFRFSKAEILAAAAVCALGLALGGCESHKSVEIDEERDVDVYGTERVQTDTDVDIQRDHDLDVDVNADAQRSVDVDVDRETDIEVEHD